MKNALKLIPCGVSGDDYWIGYHQAKYFVLTPGVTLDFSRKIMNRGI